MFKSYYQLTKPGIIYGNAIAAVAGFFLASKEGFDLKLFIAMLFGLSFVIASACVLNNVYDREMDAKMDRTKNRGLASGKIKPKNAIIFACLLLILGAAVLYFHTNNFALGAALLGFVVYVFLYTPLKSKTVYATLIGAVSGATPPVVGYSAATNNYDLGALLLFLILFFWQMPHFYAIGIFRKSDYEKAAIPILPVKQGIRAAKIQMVAYVLAFLFCAFLLYWFKFTGRVYLYAVGVLGLYWLWLCLKGFNNNNNEQWARKVFLFSLIVLLGFCITAAFGLWYN